MSGSPSSLSRLALSPLRSAGRTAPPPPPSPSPSRRFSSSPFFSHDFRQAVLRRQRQLQRQQPQQGRHLSSTAPRRAGPKKPKGSKSDAYVLEKPDKFRPPSHPAKLRSGARNAPIRQYGPETTAAERAAMKKKAYPNMMPPDGSWAHWLLTNRGIHLGFTITVLGGVAMWAVVLNVKQNSPFADMLPSGSEALWHPLDSSWRVMHVLKLSAERTSRLTAEKRARELDEVRKRKAYRLAHGLEGMDGIDEADPVFAAALASRLEREAREKRARGEVDDVVPVDAEGGVDADEKRKEERESETSGAAQTQTQPARPPVKKWLGIW